MRHGRLKNVEGKFPNLEISEEKIKNVEGKFSNLEISEEKIKNVEEKILILEISEEKKEYLRNVKKKVRKFKECRRKILGVEEKKI